ncbi:MAG: hypothetical protein AB7V50_08800 [Vampirovibrionia bacterium]
MENKLATYVLKQAPKVLSLLDKGEFSPTYGCFDRNFWHYKTVTDYPSATYQQCSLFLAHLYASYLPGNNFYQQKEILQLCISSIEYWLSIQNSDGSFNEWYPNEHSHVATAFTLYAITESLLLIKSEIDYEVLQRYKISLMKAVKWLVKNPDTVVTNHSAGALTAIYNTYMLYSDKSLLKHVDECVALLKDLQSQEGWFKEYYGADIGYTSVSIDFLAKYYNKSGDERVYNILEKAVTFLAYFMHPDGSSGGEYGNRNTKYIMPAGIHLLAKYFEPARFVLDNFYYGFKKGTQITLDNVDDRYYTFFFAPNYIEAAVYFSNLKEEDIKFDRTRFTYFSHIFSQAGIVVKKTPNYYFVCNFKKGGVIKLFGNDGNLLYSDSSYFVKFVNKKLASSQTLIPNLDYYVDNSEEDEVEIKFESPFKWVNTSLPLTKILIPFRIFNYTLGYFNFIMDYFNNHIKKKFISKPKFAPLTIKRNISIKNNVLTIEDVISKKTDLKVYSIDLPASKTNLHVPSSRYALEYDIKEFIGIDPVCVEEINKVKTTYIKTQVNISNSEKDNECSSTNSSE